MFIWPELMMKLWFLESVDMWNMVVTLKQVTPFEGKINHVSCVLVSKGVILDVSPSFCHTNHRLQNKWRDFILESTVIFLSCFPMEHIIIVCAVCCICNWNGKPLHRGMEISFVSERLGFSVTVWMVQDRWLAIQFWDVQC